MSKSDSGKETPVGFAGLAGQVSDVAATIAAAKQNSSPASQTHPASDSNTASSSEVTDHEFGAPSRADGNTKKLLLFLGAIIIGIVALASLSPPKSSPTYSPDSEYSSDADNFLSAEVDSTYTPPPDLTAEEAEPEEPDLASPSDFEREEAWSSGRVEEKPLPGSSQTLSRNEIRYCLAEQIRLEAAEAAVDNYNWPQVDRFNAMIADYNSRCGQYRYQQSNMAAARIDVESRRSSLEQEGRDRLLTGSQ